MSDNKRTVSGAVIAAMREAGWLRNDGYKLKPGFNKVLTIKEVKDTKTRGSKDLNNFRVMGSTDDGNVTIPGSMLANARMLPKDSVNIDKDPVFPSAVGVWYREAIEDILAGSQIFNEDQDMKDSGYEFPEKLQIVGAVVDEDPDFEGYPRFPMRSFKYYNQCLRHHQKLHGKDEFLTRDDFHAYLEAEGADRPKGVPAPYKELELLDSIKKEEMKNWQFTLLLADVE